MPCPGEAHLEQLQAALSEAIERLREAELTARSADAAHHAASELEYRVKWSEAYAAFRSAASAYLAEVQRLQQGHQSQGPFRWARRPSSIDRFARLLDHLRD